MNSQLYIQWIFPIALFLWAGNHAFASLPDCNVKSAQVFQKMVCKNSELKQLNQQIQETYLTTQLMSNAPLNLLKISQMAWENYVKQCKNARCIQQQFEQRIDELTLLTTMNQSFTQHYIRYKASTIDPQMTQLQIQQLDKNRIKIEGIQYRNPNNSEQNRIIHLRSYTSPDQLTEITDLDSKCKYTLQRTAHTLNFYSTDHKCKRFIGIYKLYD